MISNSKLKSECQNVGTRHFPAPFPGHCRKKKLIGIVHQWSPDQPQTSTICEPIGTSSPPHLRNSSHPIKTPLPYRENPSGHTFVPVNWWCQAAMGPTKVAELKHHGWMVMRRPKLEWIDVSISTDLEETLARRALCWKWTQEEDDKEISLQHRPPTLLAPIFHRDNPLGPLLVMTLTWGGIDTS